MDIENNFCEMYHKAIVLAVTDQVEKVKSRIASTWVKDWMKNIEGPVENADDFCQRFEGFLENDLGFAQSSKVSIGEDVMTIKVEGCRICPGNELLREAGEATLCPIIPTGLFALSRVHNTNAALLGVEKDTRVGYCTIKYSTKGKK